MSSGHHSPTHTFLCDQWIDLHHLPRSRAWPGGHTRLVRPALLIARGVAMSKRKPRRALTPHIIRRVAQSYADAAHVALIGRQFNIHPTTVCLIAKRADLPRRDRRSYYTNIRNENGGGDDARHS